MDNLYEYVYESGCVRMCVWTGGWIRRREGLSPFSGVEIWVIRDDFCI
jgi:hypothetical protein